MPNKHLLSTLLVIFSGCSSFNTDGSFQEIQLMTSHKLGSKIIWNQDDNTAKEVEAAVNKLLSNPLTLSAAVQIALINNSEIQAFYQSLGVAEADLVQAGLLQNPLFNIERRFPGKALELDVAQSFLDILFIPLKTKIASHELEGVKKKIAAEVIEHATKTKIAFFELQARIQELEMLEHVSRVMGASAFAAKKIYEAGNITELEMQNEESLSLESKVELASVENEVIQERERLNVRMGLWDKKIFWEIEKRLPNPPAQEPEGRELEKLALRERLDLASTRSELDAMRINASIAGYDAMLSQGALSFHSEAEPNGSRTRGPSLELPIPLFDQGLPVKARAEALFKRKTAQYAQAAVQIRSDVRATFNKMRVARKRAEFYQKNIIPLKTKILEQSQLQYNGMFISVFQLLQAKRDQIEAGKNFIYALRDYWIARAELEQTVGGKIVDVPFVTASKLQNEILKPAEHSLDLVKKDLKDKTINNHHHHGLK